MTPECKTILHVGCGRTPLPASFTSDLWREIRYDIDASVEPDLVGTMSHMVQVADASVDAIFSSHNLEHLSAHEVPRALREFWRVLQPGGLVWIIVPDVQSLAEKIASGDLDDELYRSPAGPITVVDVLWGHLDSLAAGQQHMAHRTGFTASTLERHLKAAGFDPVRIERRPQAFEMLATAVRPLPQETFEELFEQGRHHHAEGRWAEAEAQYRQALARSPSHWPAQYELAVVCHLQGRLDEAIALLQQVVTLEPHFARGQAALGAFLGIAGRPKDAVEHLQLAVQLEPQVAESRYNLGKALEEQKLLSAAECEYREATRLDPGHGLAHINLGKLLNQQGGTREGLALYRSGLQDSKITNPGLHSNLPMLMNFFAEAPDDEVYAAHRAFDQRFVAPLAPEIVPLTNSPKPERRLRVGYLSRDLRQHSVRYFLLPILAHHDHHEFEIACYFDSDRADGVSALFKSHADRWIECHGCSDAELAERIRKDGVDILIDVGGHTDRNRLLVFARRPAPLQVSYLGYPATTGVSTIDYRISDRCIDPEPPAARIASSEVPLRLAHGYFCYAPIPDSPAVGALPCERVGDITFGSLNQGAKLNPGLFSWWAEILHGVPDSRLWLQNSALHEEAPRQRLRDDFARLGIACERLLFRPFGPAPAYLESYQEIDIALDSFPYNGGTTSCEALWMGVPVVSLCGGRHVSRLGASILEQLGLSELVGSSPQACVDIAVKLAGDRERLRALRSTMRERMSSSPLMDHAGFVSELEARYREIWRRWCNGVR
jgi:protein O-GlcNAc transferase